MPDCKGTNEVDRQRGVLTLTRLPHVKFPVADDVFVAKSNNEMVAIRVSPERSDGSGGMLRRVSGNVVCCVIPKVEDV